MELNWILIWMAGVSSAVNLAMTWRNRRGSLTGWRWVMAAILLLLAAGWAFFPQIAGYVGGSVWFVFSLLPGLLMKRVGPLISRRQYRRAWRTARIAGWLHPFDGWRQQAELIRALDLFEQGDTAAAAAIIDRLSRLETSLGRSARLIQAQQTGNWQSLLESIDRRYSPARVQEDEALLIARLQALGELGRAAEMLRAARPVLESDGGSAGHDLDVLQLRLAALSGQVIATQRQLGTLVQTYPADVHRYWHLTAQQVAGVEGVDEEFRSLQATAGTSLQPSIARRLAQPLPVFDAASADPEAAAALSLLTERIDHEVRYGDWAGETHRRPWATWSIAAVLVAIFVLEMTGGSGPASLSWDYATRLIDRSLDRDHLIDLGALIVLQSYTPGLGPADVQVGGELRRQSGEWWRVLTAGFLHFGPLHLGLNLLGLLVLAPRLERAWGPLPMVFCYLTATVTSMALAPHVMRLTEGPPVRILVGASGGMMGLLGGLVGFQLVGWLRHRTERTRRPLLFLLVIIALQTAFDLSTPNVSFACHALGLATGAVFGTVWTWLSRR